MAANIKTPAFDHRIFRQSNNCPAWYAVGYIIFQRDAQMEHDFRRGGNYLRNFIYGDGQ